MEKILPDPLKTKFVVQFEIDGEDETFSLSFFGDLKRGKLIICAI